MIRTKAINANKALHPRRGDTWFQTISPNRRAQFHRSWREECAREAAATKHALTTLGTEALYGGVLFGMFALFAGGESGNGLFGALLAGAFVGVFWVWTQASVFLAPTIAVAAFLAQRFLDQGLQDPKAWFFAVFLAGASAYHALNRNDPGA